MIPKEAIIRIARATDNLEKIVKMYQEGLGFKILGDFYDHSGFDGVMLGHKKSSYHLEFTQHKRHKVGKAPTKDNLLVFYIPNSRQFENNCKKMINAGFKEVNSYNPYWDDLGRTFEDIDGYRIVLQNSVWEK